MKMARVATPARAWLASARDAVRRWLARADVRAALAATLALRLGTSLFAALMPLLQPSLYPWRDPLQPDHFRLAHYPPGLPYPEYGLLDYLTQPWNRWDTRWYLDVAQHGYTHYGSSAFLPLYPALMRVVGVLVGGSLLLAALLISTVAAFAAILALHRIAVRLAPLAGSGGAAVLVAITAPAAFFLMSGYTESLFLALSLWAIVAALDGAWWRFAVLAALAALTRQQGLVLAVLPAWSGLMALVRGEPGAGPWSRLRAVGAQRGVAICAPPLAYALWLLALRAVWRAPLPWEPLGAARGWGLRFAWPWTGIESDLAVFGRPGGAPLGVALAAALDLGAIGVCAALLPLAARRFPPALLLYLALSLVISLLKVEPSGLTT
ncbi:MAG TPA: mannosyltransferase family protein, partial [Ktedonobacterales bacterium]|nr:mannosyltransferase family protein [Ktedonobacterales bacterium]